MNADEQRITIAEACGWVRYTGEMSKYHEWVANAPVWTKEGATTPEGWSIHIVHELPDYVDDLNAMHEAEKTLDHKQREAYAHQLYLLASTGGIQLITCSDDPDFDGIFELLHTTAAQRAEAFLRTIGKWTD